MNTTLLQRYISGQATEEEKRLVTEWIGTNPENLREYRAQRKMYELTLWRTESESKEKVVQKRFLSRRLWMEMAGVAALLALVFISPFHWGSQEKRIEESFQTLYAPAGQRAEMTLADGTKVWLNSRSTLTFPSSFNGDVRNVKLDGEGYFAVSKNADKPFIVETSKCNVRVLGTEFNVMAYAEDDVWETSLLKGTVEVFTPNAADKTMQLEPNTKATLQGNKLIKGQITDSDYFMWREGLLCFNNISVRDMIEKLKLYYGVDIVVNNTRILSNHYTGKFRTKDGVEHVLKVLRLNNRFTYTKDDENNVITIN